jgi:adenylate cyclase
MTSEAGATARITGPGLDSVGDVLTGVEPPTAEDRTGEPIAVNRTFAFVDITGFTAYCDSEGEHAAVELLTRFRSHVRDIAARRGVRVAKWLGDGAMLVSVDEGPIVAAVAELVARCEVMGLETHAGISSGVVLLFEGDDYVGRPTNLAARLCEVAAPGQILAVNLTGHLPDWVEDRGPRQVTVTGIGELSEVHDLKIQAMVASGLGGPGAAA